MITEKGNIDWTKTLASIALDKNQLELAKHILSFNPTVATVEKA